MAWFPPCCFPTPGAPFMADEMVTNPHGRSQENARHHPPKVIGGSRPGQRTRPIQPTPTPDRALCAEPGRSHHDEQDDVEQKLEH
jgi:hypothetical protein